MKKMISVFLCVAMLMSVWAVPASSALNATEVFYEYEVLEDGTARITAYTKTFDPDSSSVAMIPREIDGYIVSEIGESAFLRAFYVETVIVPDTVKTIGASAFQESGVEQVFLPEGLETIDERAFFACANLKKLVVPSTVTAIGNHAIGFSWYTDPEQPDLVPGVVKVMPEFILYADQNAAATAYAAQAGVALTELSSLPAGDTDLDGKVDTRDVRTTLQYLMFADMGYWQAGDINGDGVFNTVDARSCLRSLLEEPSIAQPVAFDVDYIQVASGTVFAGDNSPFPRVITSEEEWKAFKASDSTVDANAFYERRYYEERFFENKSLIVLPMMGDDMVVTEVTADNSTVTVNYTYLCDAQYIMLQRAAFALVIVDKSVVSGKEVCMGNFEVQETTLHLDTSAITIMNTGAHNGFYYNNTGKYDYYNSVTLQSTQDVKDFIAEHETYLLDENGQPVPNPSENSPYDYYYMYKVFDEEDFAAYDETFFEDNVLVLGFLNDPVSPMSTPTVSYYSMNDQHIWVMFEQTYSPYGYSLLQEDTFMCMLPVSRDAYHNQEVSFAMALNLDYSK